MTTLICRLLVALSRTLAAGVSFGAAKDERRSRAQVLAALACALAPGVASAGDTSRGQFAVWAVGLPSANFIMEHQAAVIQVTPEDVARGVVQVRGGSRLVITADSPTGYAVDFYTVGKLFQAVQIDGIGSAVELGPKGGTVVQQEAAAGRRVVAINYRFFLAPDATPGTYAWPLELAVRRVVTSDVQLLAKDRRHVTLSRIIHNLDLRPFE